MKAIFKPSRAEGTIAAPPSKSMAHRMLICAGLSEGESVVEGIAPSQDVLATLDCLEALGAQYTYENSTVVIRGIDFAKDFAPMTLPCRECGSTLRFFIPIALCTGAAATFTGSQTLLQRPLTVYEKICEENGFRFARTDGALEAEGKLAAGTYTVAGNISSQFISGLLFALPLLKETSEIHILPPVESRPYIDMTLQALAVFGVQAQWIDDETLRIPGGQRYRAVHTAVEGDYSNAAFLSALNLAGGKVEVTGLKEDSLQGDRIYRDMFEKIREGCPTLDITNCPDLGPVLFAAAALCHGAVFTGTKRLAIKESDRGAAMKEELAKFGIPADMEEDRIQVYAKELQTPGEVLQGHNDHRIVMALSVLASVTGGEIDGAQAVNKSFPDFFEKLKKLKIEVNTDGMDQ